MFTYTELAHSVLWPQVVHLLLTVAVVGLVLGKQK